MGSSFLGLFLFRWQFLRDGHEGQKLEWFHLEREGEPLDGVEGDIPLGAFEPSHVFWIEVTHLRQLLLGEMPFKPQFLQSFAEQILCAGHAIGSCGKPRTSTTRLVLHPVGV